MGGFKEGTVNGWDEEDEENEDDSEPGIATVDDATDAGETEASSSPLDSDSDTDSQNRVGDTHSSNIPWILRRNSITDGREQTVQLHLQEETLDMQRTQKSTIESRLGESVRKADLREAALLVGLQHTDDVVDLLEEWGYALD